MTRVQVDWDVCENHGQCAIVAPEVFRIGEDGVLDHEESVDDAGLPAVEEAADLCPVQAIQLHRG